MALFSPVTKTSVSGTTAFQQTGLHSRKRSLWRLVAIAAAGAVLLDLGTLAFLRRSDRVLNSVILPNSSRLIELRSLAAAHPEDKDLHLALAQSYLQIKHYLSARAEFDLALKNQADAWQTLNGRVAANTVLQRFDLVRKDMEELIALRPARLETYLALSEVCEQADDLPGARQALQQVPRDADGLPRTEGDPYLAADLLATAYSHLEDWKTTLTLVETCLAKQPQRLASRVEKGRALYALGQKVESIPFLEEGAKAAPHNADLLYLLGTAYQSRKAKGDAEKAFACFQRAASGGTHGAAVLAFARECDRKNYRPAAAFAYQRASELGMEGGLPLLRSGDLMLQIGNREEGWYRRGRYYEMTGETDKALAEYTKLTTLHDCCRSGFLHLARVYSLRHQSEESIAYLLKAQQLDPDRAKDLRWMLAKSYGLAHQEDKEVALLQQLIAEGGKESQEALYQMSAIAKFAGKQDEAEDWVRRAIAANPNEADYRTELGVLLLERRSQNGRLQAAIQNLEKAVQLAPDNYRALYNLGLAYTYAGNLDEAVLTLRHAVDLQPENGNGYHALALALKQAGNADESRDTEMVFHRFEDFKQAREVLEARCIRDPSNAEAQRHLAEFHVRAGETLSAIDRYEKCLALRPQDRDARRGLAEALGSLGRREEQRTQLAILEGATDKPDKAMLKAVNTAHE